MTTNLVISEENYKAEVETAQILGIQRFQLGEILKLPSGKLEGEYGLENSRIRARKAMPRYKRMDEETESVLLTYERELARVQSGKSKLKITEGRCGICHQETRAGYSACAVCLDIYHHEVREGFLKSLDSCQALRIIDGI